MKHPNRPVHTSFSHDKLAIIEQMKKMTDKSFSTVMRRVLDQGILVVSRMSESEFTELMEHNK